MGCGGLGLGRLLFFFASIKRNNWYSVLVPRPYLYIFFIPYLFICFSPSYIHVARIQYGSVVLVSLFSAGALFGRGLGSVSELV